jgi:uncharacterized membrane protein
MTSPLIASYVTGLRRKLPGAIADEAAEGLLETYQHHRASGAGDHRAARAAVAEFGNLATVVDEFTRQAPGRRAARLLLATGPVAAVCWAAALITSRAWTWPAPGSVLLGFGAVLVVTVAALLTAATSRHSYHRTRLAVIACPALLALDAAAVTYVLAAAPDLTGAMLAAVCVSVARMALTARTLPGLAAR